MNNLFMSFCLLIGGCGDNDEDPRAAYFRAYLGVDATQLEVQQLDKTPAMLETPLEKPVVLNIWATWCPPCIEELPSLNRLAQQGHYQVIALSVDRNAERLQTFLQKYASSVSHLTVWHNPGGRAVAKLLGATQYPVTYLLNTNGIVQRIYTGAREWDHPAMVNKLDTALK